MFNLDDVQSALRELGVDGWLFFDFHGSNVIARRILDIPGDAHTTRRFYYYVPAEGEPTRLNHRIEQKVLDHLPGKRRVYLRWRELEEELAATLSGARKVAMEYSPRNGIPYVSVVDAGTVELVRSFDIDVVSSGDLIQAFEATLNDEQWQLHLDAERHMLTACNEAWRLIASRVSEGNPTSETEVQSHIMDYFARNGIVTDHPPIIGAGPHSGDPHYAPSPLTDSRIGQGEFVLIDLWGKLDKPGAVVADYTRVGFVGGDVPEKYARIFQIVAAARDNAIKFVRERFANNEPIHGWEVDDAARGVIDAAGYGDHFIHRTGHNIAQETHGNGTHMDNLETHDDRVLLRRTCFSVEPGIYLDEFGVRSEVDVYIDANGHVHVTGEPQQEVLAILGR